MIKKVKSFHFFLCYPFSFLVHNYFFINIINHVIHTWCNISLFFLIIYFSVSLIVYFIFRSVLVFGGKYYLTKLMTHE